MSNCTKIPCSSRRVGDRSHSLDIRGVRPHEPARCVLLQYVPVLAPHLEDRNADSTVDEGTRSALISADPGPRLSAERATPPDKGFFGKKTRKAGST
jgi:hypothetical protein